jgi:hypothetical protein
LHGSSIGRPSRAAAAWFHRGAADAAKAEALLARHRRQTAGGDLEVEARHLAPDQSDSVTSVAALLSSGSTIVACSGTSPASRSLRLAVTTTRSCQIGCPGSGVSVATAAAEPPGRRRFRRGLCAGAGDRRE